MQKDKQKGVSPFVEQAAPRSRSEIRKAEKLFKLFTKKTQKIGSSTMRLVILESPYKGTSAYRFINWLQRKLNIYYARKCLKDSLNRGEAPIASHLLYTQVLDDNSPLEREIGLETGLAWRRVAEASVVYIDRGVSNGMRVGINVAADAGVPTEYRRLWK
jgi:hypothetical protein